MVCGGVVDSLTPKHLSYAPTPPTPKSKAKKEKNGLYNRDPLITGWGQ